MTICPIIVSRGPPSSAGVMKNPSEAMKTSRPAEATPGIDNWKYTRQNALTAEAPIVAAACGRRRSICVHHRQHRDDCQWQHRMRHAENHGAAAEQEFGRLRDPQRNASRQRRRRCGRAEPARRSSSPARWSRTEAAPAGRASAGVVWADATANRRADSRAARHSTVVCSAMAKVVPMMRV